MKTTFGQIPGLKQIRGFRGLSALIIVLLALGGFFPLLAIGGAADCDFCIDYSKDYDSQVVSIRGSSGPTGLAQPTGSNNPAWNNPASNNPASNDPASNNPASNNPASNNPASNDPASNNPASNGPAINPASANPDRDGIGVFLLPISAVLEDNLILDISPDADEYIEGAISVNYEEFITKDGRIRPVSEISGILGRAGISWDDSVVIYGECLPCGTGPVPATFTYWLFKYLGHDQVRILDGDVEDWKAAGLSVADYPATRPATVYAPQVKADLYANYNYVKSGIYQIVDARSAEAAAPASIPGAVNIPLDSVLDGDDIKSPEELKEIFRDLRTNRPVAVYTNTGIQAAVTWFALEMTGYDAVLYSWRDWLESHPALEVELIEATAEPNPVRASEAVWLAAAFSDPEAAAARPVQLGRTASVSCVPCGFGSPQSFANLDSAGGTVRIGGPSSGASSGLPSAGGAAAAKNPLKVTAMIVEADGEEVGRAELLAGSDENYVGIWSSEGLEPGVYGLNILAERSGSTRFFRNVLAIEVLGE
ncbi:sulfurtransferase [Candidatus Methanocrinis alkalitolerans]|uniref:sulfurtransferase n=1 Tax=Candidatus Methanocrinis alkalitolerans TaxID=3033395 RepID=UPI002934C754|nr:rhodanese-like domain-containing protein [Candidatus Methanocrinis alkalitolerans]